MHRQFPSYLTKGFIDTEQPYECIRYSGLNGETEGLITVLLDQTLNSRYYCKHIMQHSATDKCRMHYSQIETSYTGVNTNNRKEP